MLCIRTFWHYDYTLTEFISPTALDIDPALEVVLHVTRN